MVSEVAEQLEGQYKWYVLGAVLLVITALITRFIFRTFKWFILLLLLGGFLFGMFWGLNKLAVL